MYPSMTIEEILTQAIERSAEAFTAFVDGEIVCTAGVTTYSLTSTVARPWLIPHYENMYKYKFEFLKANREWIKHLLTKYEALENLGTSANTRAVKWLKWLGFKTFPPITVNGHEYIPYRIERQK